MQKRNGRGRASLRELDLHRLYTCAVNDVSRYLPDGEVGALHRALSSSPERFRDVVDSLLHSTETGLASGGAVQYIALRQLQALLKKNPDWRPIGQAERSLAAYTKFELAELKCKITNKRLDYVRGNWSRTKRYAFYAKVVNTASLLVQELLGPLDHDISREILEECKFGSGASFGHTSELRHLYWKLSGKHTVTQEALPMLREWMALSPRIHSVVKEHSLTIVEGNRLSFVPKDWDIDRTIAVEPSWNVLLQLGINGYLARRLRKYGIELDNQARGWPLAKSGSISSDYSTIDLSSASDTISSALVSWLLPGNWFRALDSLRSKNYYHNGLWRKYSKFSSMGNGFTFPLETVIFHSLAKATAICLGLDSKGLTVYGDDIVVPRQLYAPLVEVLRFSGFEPNSKKSYTLGHFRETCGRDYLQGLNVRPVYLRRRPRSVDEVYSLYNRLYTFSLVPLPSTLQYLSGAIKQPHYGPGILSRSDTSLDDLSWKRDSRRYESYFFSDPTTKPRWSKDYQSHLYTIPILDRKSMVDKNATDELLRYLCFLSGVEGGIIHRASSVKWFERVYKTSLWPSMVDVRRFGLESRDT